MPVQIRRAAPSNQAASQGLSLVQERPPGIGPLAHVGDDLVGVASQLINSTLGPGSVADIYSGMVLPEQNRAIGQAVMLAKSDSLAPGHVARA